MRPRLQSGLDDPGGGLVQAGGCHEQIDKVDKVDSVSQSEDSDW